MLGKIILYWLPMIAIAFINAAVREVFLVKKFSLTGAHQLSTISLIIFCAVYTWLIFPFLKINSAANAFIAGTAWVLLTVIFEFAIGFGTGKKLPELLEQYNLLRGNIWPLFLLALFFMPYVVLRLK